MHTCHMLSVLVSHCLRAERSTFTYSLSYSFIPYYLVQASWEQIEVCVEGSKIHFPIGKTHQLGTVFFEHHS